MFSGRIERCLLPRQRRHVVEGRKGGDGELGSEHQGSIGFDLTFFIPPRSADSLSDNRPWVSKYLGSHVKRGWQRARHHFV